MSNSVVVGIDLGTTNSVVAVPGQYPDHGIVFGNVTVLWDEFERTTHASAVCQVDDELVVGDDAKAMASEGFAPARFVKKYMGTEKTFLVGQGEWLPEKVSSEILRHLCRIAEKALGAKVSGAVITHPAYFDGVAIDATKQAGIDAGLDVAGLLMEPVAAAMAYCDDDEQGDLRVLVYDLGGGTFDITLVERSGAAFRPVSFGGDRELGGYNFDKTIAMKMLESLREKGYQLTIDKKQPERDPRWATLMHYAEEMKFKLSAEGSTKGVIRVPNVFKDDSRPPKAVQLAFSMSREEFVGLIASEVDKTVRETHKVLENANLKPDDIDMLVMVGGSSRVSAIRERLAEEFGLEPKCEEDVLDLSVAVGAATVAASAGTAEKGVVLNAIPEETEDTEVVFSGQVQPGEERANVANLPVTVRGGVAGEETTMTSADGKFYLEIELEPETDNSLTLRVEDAEGNSILERSYMVSHTLDAEPPPPPPPPPILPKPIFVDTVTGFSILADEGVTLPYKGHKAFQTEREVTEIEIALFQENMPLTVIPLDGFSQPVPVNCRVELEFEISTDYEMKATATVPSASIKKSRQVKLQKLVVPSIEELHEQFTEVRQNFENVLENMREGEQKAKGGAKGDLIIEEIESLLSAEFPEALQIFMLIKELHLLAKQLAAETTGLDPAKSVMDEKFREARDLLPQAIREKESIREQNVGATLDALETEAQRAYQQNDAGTWKGVARRVDGIIEALKEATKPPPPPPPPAIMLAQAVKQVINGTRQEIAAKRQSGDVSPENATRASQELDAAEQKLNQVDFSDEDRARLAIASVYREHIVAAQQLAGVTETEAGSVLREI